MTRKIFRSTILVTALVLCASLLIIIGCLYDYFGGVQEKFMENEIDLAALAVERDGMDYLESIHPKDYRITWVSSDGKVLYDSQVDASSMENHKDRI